MDITESTTERQGSDDWLLPTGPEDDAASSDDDTATTTTRHRQWLTSGGLLAAGAVTGVVIVLAAGHGGSSATQFTPAASVPGGQSNGQVQPGLPPAGAFPRGDDDGADDGGDARFTGPGGGLAGEQQLQGTLTRVGASTITVRTSAGTSTYTVNDATQIVRNGAVVGLGSLKAGDPVLVHVYPSGSGGPMVVERVFAGDLPAFPGAPGSGGPDGRVPPAGTTSGTTT